MPNTRTQPTSRNLLLQTYICAAELATWGVGPDGIGYMMISVRELEVAIRYVHVCPQCMGFDIHINSSLLWLTR